MIWIKAAFAIIFAIFVYLSYGSMHKHKPESTQITKSQKEYSAHATRLKHQVVKTMMNLKGTLEGIKDIDSAKAAVPRLEQVARELNGYLEPMKDLTIDDAHQIRQYIMDFVPHLKQPLIRIRGLQGAIPVIEGAIKKIDTDLMYYKVIK